MNNVIPPFRAEHRERAREALRLVAYARELIAKGERCDKDCREDAALADLIERSLEGYRKEFLEPSPP